MARSRSRRDGFGLNRAAVEHLSREWQEPDWLRERRLAAWQIAEALPLPTGQEEEWRRTDLSMLTFDDKVPFVPVSTPALTGVRQLPATLRTLAGVAGRTAGLVAQQDGTTLLAQLDPGLQEKGVIFGDLGWAAKTHADRVQPHLMTQVIPANDDKFAALNGAFWHGGVFLYVPRGVTVDLPLQAVYDVEHPHLAIFPHTLIVAEPGSEVTLIESYASRTSRRADAQVFHGGLVEVIARPGSRVRLVSLQDWGRNVVQVSTSRAHVGRDAGVYWITASLGAQLMKARLQSYLQEPGGESEFLGVYYANGTQHLDHTTVQDHLAPNTRSDLLFKGVLCDQARVIYQGSIRVRPGAQKADAYQANRNLILSRDARADSIPALEIEADDVRCTHGVAVSQLDEEQIFYLMARGLPRKEAMRLIVEGFFDPVIARIPLPAIQKRIRQAIAARMAFC